MSSDEANRVLYFWDAAYFYDRPPNYYFDPEQGLLQPYIKLGRVEDCPSAADVAYTPVRYTAYGYNSALWFVSLPSVERTAETLLIADCSQLNVNRQLTRAAALAKPSSYKVYTAAALHGRHQGRANLLWADGHTSSAVPRYPDDLPDSAQMHRDNLGYLLPPGVDFGDARRDYYYMAKKP